jgi:hypothetical protein
LLVNLNSYVQPFQSFFDISACPFTGSIAKFFWVDWLLSLRGHRNVLGAVRREHGFDMLIWCSGSFTASIAVFLNAVHRRILVQSSSGADHRIGC